jgi:RNA-binding protein YlmH
VVDDPAHQVEEGDIVSVAGFGRFQVFETTGPTRSGRMRMRIGILS